MPRVEKLGKKKAAKVLHLLFPDGETQSFWRATADSPAEYAARIARFSRALGKEQPRNGVQLSEPRWQEAAAAVQSRRSGPLARVLIMPSRCDPRPGPSSSMREKQHREIPGYY
jgi:hypothetical protein